MKLTKSMKRALAYVLVMAIAVTSMIGYQTRTVDAAATANASDGRTYTMGDPTGNYVGFTLQGQFDNVRFGFAWSGDTAAASATANVVIMQDENQVKDLGEQGNGMSIWIADSLADLAVGEYTVVFTGTGDFTEQVQNVPLTIAEGSEVETTTVATSTYEWEAIDYTTLTYADEATLSSKYVSGAQYATVGTCPIDNVVAEADGMWILAGAYGKAIQVYLNGELKAESTANSAIGYKMTWDQIPTSNTYNDITIVFTNSASEIVEYRYVIYNANSSETPSEEPTTEAEPYEWKAIDYTTLTYADEATLDSKYVSGAQYATVGTCPIDNVVAEADGMWILAGAYGKAIQVYLNGELKAESTANSAIGYKMTWDQIPTSNAYNDITVVFTNSASEVIEYRYVIYNANASSGPVTDAGVTISGWQIAAGNLTVNGTTYDGGVRTVYKIADTVAGKSTEGATVGLVYGLAGKATEADMYVGSESNYVANMNATSAGQLADGSYAMIMASNLSVANANAINQTYYVRAYVVIDGTYYYSDVESYSTYNVAKTLYDGNQMQSEAGHAYIYNLIKKVTPDYAEVVWNNNNSLAN